MNSTLSGLLLPLRLYFQPVSLKAEIGALRGHPDQPHYALMRVWREVRDNVDFRCGLARLAGRYVLALLWVPLVTVAVHVLMPHADPGRAALIVPLMVMVGIVLGLSTAVQRSVTTGLALGVGFGVVMGIGVGIASPMLDTLAYDIYGVVSSDAVAKLVDSTADLPLMVVYGSMVGLALAMIFGAYGSARQAMLVALLLGGGAVALFALAPRFIPRADPAQVPSNTLFALSFLLTVSHLWALPIQWIAALLVWLGVLSGPDRAASLWRLWPVHWDELLLLPMPGTVRLLVRLHRLDPAQGQAALEQVARHPFQSWAARRARSRLAEGGESAA